MTDAGDISFGREALKGVSAKLAMFVFGFAATAYFARELGPAVFGGFYLLLSVVQFGNRIPHGLAGACQKRLAESQTSNEEILGLALGGSLLASCLATAAAFFFRDQLVSYTGIPNAALLAVLLFFSISIFLSLQFLLAGTGRFGLTNWIDLLRDVVKTVGQFVLVVLGFGVTGMAVGFVGATLLCIPVVLYLLAVRPAVPSSDTTKYVWEYAKFNVPSNVVGKAYTRFDVFLLGAVGLTAAVGYYEVALAVTAIATLVSSVVMDGVISRVSNLSSRDRPIDETITATISYTSVIAIPLLVFVFFLGDPLVRTLYGPEYLAAVPFLGYVCLYRVLQTQREPLDSAVKGMGRPDLVFRISCVTLALNFVLGVALVFTIGPVGVIIATVAAEGLRWGLLHVALRREGTDVPLVPSPIRAQLASALVMAAVMAGALWILPALPAYQLGLAGTLGCLSYAVALLVQDRAARRATESLFDPLLETWPSSFVRPGT